jgi:probable HAF family extracellular repeat protein
VKADTARYTFTDLGSLGCCNYWIWESTAIAINNAGEIVGTTTSPTDPSVTLPFIYRNGRMTAITDRQGEAVAINDAGQVTGYVIAPDNILARAFRYRNGVFTDIGTLPFREHSAMGYAINSTGTIVGGSGGHAFIYRHGIMWPVPGLGANYATGVNDAGDVVGLIETSVPDWAHNDHAFLFRGLRFIDLGTIDGIRGVSYPVGVNNRGQVGGWSDTAAGQRAFLWEDGVFQNLGSLHGGYSYASALNNHGDVVGASDASVYLYHDGAMIDLNEALPREEGAIWPRLQDVRGINDLGQIVGLAYVEDADGVVHLRACLLTPVAGS